jgi:hypothetical protein
MRTLVDCDPAFHDCNSTDIIMHTHDYGRMYGTGSLSPSKNIAIIDVPASPDLFTIFWCALFLKTRNDPRCHDVVFFYIVTYSIPMFLGQHLHCLLFIYWTRPLRCTVRHVFVVSGQQVTTVYSSVHTIRAPTEPEMRMVWPDGSIERTMVQN